MTSFIEEMENMYSRSYMAESVTLPGQTAHDIAAKVLAIDEVLERWYKQGSSGSIIARAEIRKILRGGDAPRNNPK